MSAPLNLIRSLIDESVHVKLRDNRELRGQLHAYDEHCNLVLGQSTETVYSWSTANTIEKSENHSDMLFVRGDQVIFVRANH